MDTFLAAATIPTILFGVFNGALVSALVPTFSEYITHGHEDDAWALGNTIINSLAIVLTVVRSDRLAWPRRYTCRSSRTAFPGRRWVLPSI